jgi:hypothetical protein
LAAILVGGDIGLGQGEVGRIALQADEPRLRPPRRRRQERGAGATPGLDRAFAGGCVAGRRQQRRVQPGAIAAGRLG